MANYYTEKYANHKIIIEEKPFVPPVYFYKIQNETGTKTIKESKIPFPLKALAIKIAKKDVDKVFNDQIKGVTGSINKKLGSAFKI